MNRVALKPGLLTSIDSSAEPRLLGSRCTDCRQLHFPATDSCPYCSAGGCARVELGNRGSLYVYTVVEKPPPGYRGKAPYGFGVVELPEGIRIVSRLTENAIDRLQCGMPMRLVLEEIFVDDTGAAVIGWAFAPDTRS